jgi:NarL family two-component system sensor histidine kinase LiaS
MRQLALPFRQLHWQLSLSYLLTFSMTVVALLGIGLTALASRPLPSPSDQLVHQLEETTLVSLMRTAPSGPSLEGVIHRKLPSNLIDTLSTLAVTRVLGVLIQDSSGQEISASSIPGEEIQVLAARLQSRAVIRAAFANESSPRALAATLADGTTVAAVPLVDSGNNLVGILFVAVQGLRPVTSPPVSLSVLTEALSALPVLVALILIIGLSGTCFCIMTARRLTARLRRMATAVHAWSQGEFQAAIVDASLDELGHLAEDLNQMAQELQSLFTTRQQLALIEERQRVARDLHDSVKQQAFAITLLIGAAMKALDKDTSIARSYLTEAEELSYQTRQELTGIIQETRMLALPEGGLIVVLQEYLRRWSQRNSIAVEADFPMESPVFSPNIEEVLLRVTQEALANIARHSGATLARVQLTGSNDEISLHVCDDGHGFAPAIVAGTGVGLSSMRERVEKAQGALRIESDVNGTHIVVCLPCKRVRTVADTRE